MVDHYDSYTYSLVDLFATVTGELPTVVDHDRTTWPEIAGFSHFVLSPGPGHPGNPSDFGVGREVLRYADRPVLGVCLGMQAMVDEYGGRVAAIEPAHGEVAEVRHEGVGLFAGVPSPTPFVRYHSLAAVKVSDVLSVTAVTEGADGTDVVMAVAHRDRPQWGVQFHPESILSDHGERLVANFLANR